MARRRLSAFAIVALALAAAWLGAAQNLGEPSDLRDSECFRCHEVGGGAFGPPLRAMYAIIPPDVEIEPGVAVDFPVDIINTWTAELRDMEAVLSLSDAPSLGFATDIEPLLFRDDLQLSGVAAERTVETRFDLEPGATEMTFRAIAPGAIIGTPAVGLRITPPVGPTLEIPPSAGGADHRIVGREAIAEAGSGEWRVEAFEALTDLPSALVPQPVEIRVGAWFNSTGERVQSLALPGILDGQDDGAAKNVTALWRIVAQRPPSATESLRVIVNVTAYYNHPGSTSGGIDDWRFGKELVLQGSAPEPDDPGEEEPEAPVRFGNGTTEPLPEPEEAIPWDRIGEIIGYVSAFLLILSMISGGVFGKGSRRGLNKIFRSAKRRVAFHNFLSYFLTLFAVGHTVLFILEPGFPWTLGIIWGSLGLLAMLLLGVTGALQVPMVRRWDYGTWKWTHFWLAIAAIVFTIVHMLLDGANFTEISEAAGWQDPFA